MTAPIAGNRAVENAAVAWVMELERGAGREPIDKRGVAAFSADLESAPRIIEVKAFGTSNRGFDLWLEVKQVEEARRNPNFWLYAVENVKQGDPLRFTLKVFGGDKLARILARAREKRYFEVPLGVREYDSAPGIEGLR